MCFGYTLREMDLLKEYSFIATNLDCFKTCWDTFLWKLLWIFSWDFNRLIFIELGPWWESFLWDSLGILKWDLLGKNICDLLGLLIYGTSWSFLLLGLVGINFTTSWNFLLELLGLYHAFFETCWRYFFTGHVGINFYKTCRDYLLQRPAGSSLQSAVH